MTVFRVLVLYSATPTPVSCYFGINIKVLSCKKWQNNPDNSLEGRVVTMKQIDRTGQDRILTWGLIIVSLDVLYC